MREMGLYRRDEQAIFALRSLYRKYGYLPYKMRKFEDYDLYLRNRDFLASDRVIAFNDTNGQLMALKPDVTLSIIKQGDDVPGMKQKLCYNENVYRVSDGTKRFKEIMQAGLECIGAVDFYDIYEVISLAAQSLAQISPQFELDVSQMDVAVNALKFCLDDDRFIARALGCISQKNAHDLAALCGEYGIDERDTQRIQSLVYAYGPRDRVLRILAENFGSDAVDELRRLSEMLDASPYSDRICYDFSVVNDLNYYNGFVFRGYLDGISDRVLAGGQYDRMMARMQRASGAIGFALYLDLLEQLGGDDPDADVDVLLLYDASVGTSAVAAKVQSLILVGLSVSAQMAVPDRLRYRQLIDLRGRGMEKC